MIFLTGFMGSGKTTVGQELARRTGRPFLDLDTVITEKSGASIPDIFRCAGEEAFRVMETRALRELAAEADPSCIVATGGGLPADPLNRAVMKACGGIVYLKASFESMARRIEEDGTRPLWNQDARSLLEKRIPAYEDSDLTVETDGVSVMDVSSKILAALPDLPAPVGVILPGNPYPVHVGKGVFQKVLPLIRRHIDPEGLFVLVDESVVKYHAQTVRDALRGCRTHCMTVPSGERSKSMEFLNTVLDAMFSRRVNRQWACLAVGGGVVGDLAGFAAGIYMRGIPVIQAATTLLAQVDSGIGGKAAVNHAYGKNLIGTFHQPLAVISDVDFLSTLDGLQLRSAMAEAVKYGIIMDAPLFEYLESGPPHDYTRIVEMCARDKARVVAQDEREEGVRRILNFGHTLGHAVEKTSGYAVSHGEAVAMGMAFASQLSHDRGMLPLSELNRIMKLMRRERLLPRAAALPSAEEAAIALEIDKKGGEGGIHFVLTPSIGDVSVQKLSEIEVLEAYRGFADGYSKGL